MKTTKEDREDRQRRDGYYNRASKPENQFVSRLIADVDDATALLANVVEAAELVRGNPQNEDLWNELMDDDGHVAEAAAFLKEPKQ